MIYYFSGTRNSRYAAMRIGSVTEEEARFIPAIDAYSQEIDPSKDKSVGFVFPVYAWGVPPIVMDFIRRLPERFVQDVRDGKMPVWCVATCGDETGMAVEMLRKNLAKRGLELSGAWSLIMPNVYVLLPGFGTDPKEVEERKLSDAVGRIEHIASGIKSGKWEEDIHVGPWPRVKTSLVYPLFKRWGINTKKWHYTDECIGCGKCARACPVGNIAMTDGHPEWGTDCTSCCACYHVCPTRGAQYGSVTKNAGQYVCSIHNA
ncbi:MAG: EFR1 family ferrodoxin [Muribaculaceae bacterium]|nr:EFR1 family ferrodoxin [Muribaculaceae bacterium]